jgi:hypothetical protein
MKRGYRVTLIVLAVLTLLLLALNGAFIYGLLRARQTALKVLADARATAAGIGDETFSYTVEIHKQIPVAASVPFHEEVTVPVQTTVPISTSVVVPVQTTEPIKTSVVVPIDLGTTSFNQTVPLDLGTISYDLTVPISMVVPIDLEFTVPVSKTVDIATTVPVDLVLPIEIPIANTPLVGYLEDLDAYLAKLEAKLASPLGAESP